MIIDLHCHTTDHLLWDLHTKNATLSFLRSQAKKYGITKIYLMATCFPLKKSGLSNIELLKRISNDPLFGIFGTLNAELLKLKPALDELWILANTKRISGIKLYPGYQDFNPMELGLMPLYELAHEFSLPIAWHMGELHPCCQTNNIKARKLRCGKSDCPLEYRAEQSHPKVIEAIARKFPEVKFIACHLANPYFEDLRRVMADCPNIYTDISGQFVSGTDEDTPNYRASVIDEIHKFLELPDGYSRVMFATDFPIQSYEDTLQLVDGLKLTAEQKDKILFQNALNLLRAEGEKS